MWYSSRVSPPDDDRSNGRAAPDDEPEALGPDPVWGVGLFVVGLVVMATGGAMTWHYVFNVGEGILLFGAVVFLLFVAISSQKQDPIRLRTALLRALGRDVDGD